MEKKKFEVKKLVKMDGVNKPFSDSVKYLDSKLSWKTHIDKKQQLAKS